MSNLIKKLKRDCKKSPGKTAFLAVVCVIAVSVWGSQIWGLISPKKKARSKVAAKATPTSTKKLKRKQKTDIATEMLAFDWEQVGLLRRSDVNTRPERLAQTTRNPFMVAPKAEPSQSISRAQIELAEGTKETPELEEVSQSPSELGLQLFATLLGANVKVAQISGYRYEVGDTISVLENEVIDPSWAHQLTDQEVEAAAKFGVVDIVQNRVCAASSKHELRADDWQQERKPSRDTTRAVT